MNVKDKSFKFSLLIIDLYKKLIIEKEYVISKQLLKSGTSVGANIEEANAGISKKEFAHKMSIASKEARETLYWLRLLNESKLVELDVSIELDKINELIKMLTSIVKTTQENLNKR
jgi:four helix bundle protein